MDKKPTNDAELKTALDKLFNDWKGAVPFGDSFVEDGALPGYFDQKFKILFIGKESYGCEDDQLMDGYHNGTFKNPAYHLVDKVAYGLLNNKEWSELPERENIPRPPKGFSFAFVNVSKYANLEGSKRSKHFLKYVEASLGDNNSGRNFTRDEIDLLNPDLIISWNLSGIPLVDFMMRLTGSKSLDDSVSENVDLWTYNSSFGREIPLLDTWHFSAIKKHKECFYDPIMKAVKKLIAEGKLKPKQG